MVELLNRIPIMITDIHTLLIHIYNKYIFTEAIHNKNENETTMMGPPFWKIRPDSIDLLFLRSSYTLKYV